MRGNEMQYQPSKCGITYLMQTPQNHLNATGRLKCNEKKKESHPYCSHTIDPT